MRRWRLGAVLVFGMTACVATAAPAGFHGEKLRLNASDQAFAHTVTLRRSDFVPSAYGSVWRRVRAKPVVSALPQCPVDADMSTFVITGIARTRWLGGNLELDSQAAVLEKPWMLSGEWNLRTHALGCLRRAFSKAVRRDGGTLISFQTLSLPRIAPKAIGLRMLVIFDRFTSRSDGWSTPWWWAAVARRSWSRRAALPRTSV